MSLTIVNAQQVRSLLPMADCVDVMADAMLAVSGGTVQVPPRQFYPLMDNSGALGLMPGFSTNLQTYGAKLISLHRDNPSCGLPAIQGFVALFDHTTGTPIALIDGAEITGIRTAAASGLATRLLARECAATCGIFGSGVQASTHIDAIRAVRPVEHFLVWGRDGQKAAAFAQAEQERTGVSVQPVTDAAEAASCDVICTVTGSSEPVLLGEWLQPGAHVNAVGAHSLTTREVDSALIANASVYVDVLESAYNEGGDVMIPVDEGVVSRDHIVGEIGQVLSGTIPARRNAQQITFYNSLGITAQDLFAARVVYDRAVERGLGTQVDF